MTADATYGQQMRFTVKLSGGAPDSLDLLLRFTGSEPTEVAPVDPGVILAALQAHTGIAIATMKAMKTSEKMTCCFPAAGGTTKGCSNRYPKQLA